MSVVDNKDINKIFSKYFDIIDSYFGSIKHYLKDAEDSHIDLSVQMARYPLISDLIIDAIDDIDVDINKFWQENAKSIFDFIRNRDSLKCLYSGDISPVILENFVKKTALYLDSVILPDPVFNLTLFQKQIILDKKYYLQKLIRHVFNIWKLKRLVLLDSREKAILILPISLQLVNSEDREKLIVGADTSFVSYINGIFGQSFSDGQSCLDFLSQETTAGGIFKRFKNINLLPNVFANQESLNKFLLDFSNTGKFVKFKDNESTGWDFGVYLRSQFVRVQEHKFFCEKLSAEPIYDYELPWFFFNYEMGGVDIDAAIANALQNEKFNWISNVPLSAIEVLRNENKLDYMRSILRQGITDLKAKNDKCLLKTGEQIEKNLKEAFNRQEKEISSLQQQVNTIVRKDIPIISGGFLAGFVPYISNIISLLFAGRDIKNALGHRKTLTKEIAHKQNDFISLLIKSYERKT